MAKYIHSYDTVEENYEDYQIGGENYREPWTSSIKRSSRGIRYTVKYNKILDVFPNSLLFNATGGTKSFVIDSITPWQITNESNWVTISPLTGSTGETTVTITVSSTTQDRNASFTIVGNSGKTNTITVEQTYNEVAGPPPSIIWVDDFPDGTDDDYSEPYDPEFCDEFYGYESMDDYFDEYVEDPESYWSNKCEYTNETIEFNGDEFYVYSFIDVDSDEERYYALLPITSSFNSLYPHSIEDNHNNRYQPFAYILNLDDSVYWDAEDDGSGGKDFVLVKVEE